MSPAERIVHSVVKELEEKMTVTMSCYGDRLPKLVCDALREAGFLSD